MRRWLGAAPVIALVAAVGGVSAGGLAIEETVSLNAIPRSFALSCTSLPTLVPPTCEELVPDTGVEELSLVPLVVSDPSGSLSGIGGLQFGIEYSPELQVNWTLCSGGAEIPSSTWPASGSGNAMTFGAGCVVPTEENQSVGFFTLVGWTDGSYFALTPDPRIGQAVIATCGPEAEEFEICDAQLSGGNFPLAFAASCETTCDSQVPVEVVSWSVVKACHRVGRAAGEEVR